MIDAFKVNTSAQPSMGKNQEQGKSGKANNPPLDPKVAAEAAATKKVKQAIREAEKKPLSSTWTLARLPP
jgi:hypothetical protein